MYNPDYAWRPDPKGERIPQTLFGMPITFTDMEKATDEILILGALDDYMDLELEERLKEGTMDELVATALMDLHDRVAKLEVGPNWIEQLGGEGDEADLEAKVEDSVRNWELNAVKQSILALGARINGLEEDPSWKEYRDLALEKDEPEVWGRGALAELARALEEEAAEEPKEWSALENTLHRMNWAEAAYGATQSALRAAEKDRDDLADALSEVRREHLWTMKEGCYCLACETVRKVDEVLARVRVNTGR